MEKQSHESAVQEYHTHAHLVDLRQNKTKIAGYSWTLIGSQQHFPSL